MTSAGFTDTSSRDVTDAYLATIRSWVSATELHRERLAVADGEEIVAERLQLWREAATVIERGWLLRTIYWGARK